MDDSMRAKQQRKSYAVVRTRQELDLLKQIDTKLDRIETRVDNLQEVATKQGAIAGAVAGGIAGGLVATGITLIKARLGL